MLFIHLYVSHKNIKFTYQVRKIYNSIIYTLQRALLEFL